jgi:methionine-gamma-lyase
MNSRKPFDFDTLSVHGGPEPDPSHGAVSVPIYQSSTFSFRSTAEGAARFSGADPGYKYTRLGNPTTRALEQCVAEMEEGVDGLATASGMAAISTVFLGLLSPGDHVVGTDAVYGPTRLLLERHLERFGIRSSWVASEEIEEVRAAIRPETRMLYIETPANPTLKLTDLRACAAIAREAGALLVVDNTFSSPVLQHPIRLGADVVVHSMTKYLNGHSDVVAGIIVSATQELHARLASMLHSLGGIIDPHQAWLVLRGIKTLSLRVHKAQGNARALASWLSTHPEVAWVSYPGLPTHPQHELMKRQMEGPGSMITFGVPGGLEAARRVIEGLKLATLAVSLGGVESLVEHPASMTHAGLSREEREASGITDDLIRLSVGCEGVEDLKADLEGALREAAVPALG